MEKSIIPLLFAILFYFNGHSQSCFPGGITFTSQAEVDNFIIDYPDCTTIEGDITIAEAEAVKELKLGIDWQQEPAEGTQIKDIIVL